jgi:hypothetical protein
MQLAALEKAFWPKGHEDPKRVKVWVGGGYLVQAFDEAGGVVRLTVNSAKNDGRNWADRIPWDDLQAIKSACGYGDRDAVEVYPPTRDVVNVANMRHLWVLSDPLPFAWRRGATA